MRHNRIVKGSMLCTAVMFGLAIGVNGDGDGDEQDENVAEAGAVGFEPIEAIRIDSVTKGGVAYTDRPGSE